MPYCPSCKYEMEKPPADVQEWFRCPGCGVPLRVPSETTKFLFVVGIVVMAALFVFFTIVVGKLFPGRDFAFILTDGTFAVVSGVVLRLFWKTKMSRLSLYDPYSALNLSDAKKRMRGRS